MTGTGLRGQLSDFDLRLLRIFVAVAECGGMAAAEAELNINRSTISIHISDLESRLGMQVCYRSRGRAQFSLTPQGEALYHSIKELMHYLEGFRDQVNAIQSDLTGRLKIALPDDWLEMSEASIDLSEVIAAFRDTAPKVNLEIVTRSPHEVDFDILNNRADIGINTVHVRRPGLQYFPIFRHRSYLYCSSRHPLFDVSPDQLTAETVLRCDLVASGHRVQTETRSLIELFNHQAQADHMEGCLLLIQSGKYLGFLPEYYAGSRAGKYPLCRLLPDTFYYSAENALIYRKSTGRSKVASLFIRQLTEAVKLQLHNSASG